jgi:hypothetical protein
MAATKRTADFTNVKDGGNFNPKRKPAGDYLATIAAVADHASQGDPNGWVFTITLEDDVRATYPYYCQTTAKALWKVRNLFIAAGKDVPKKRVVVDPNKIVGQQIGISLDDDEYEGNPKSVISATFPKDELTEDSPAGGGSDDAEDLDDETVEDDLEVDEL